MALGIFQEEPYDVPKDQQAAVPGGPARVVIAPPRRLLYAIVGLLLVVTGGLSNALVTVNLSKLLGAYAVTPQEAAWLPVAYAMTYISANLLLVKFRQQFGLRLFAMLGLIAFCAAVVGQVFIGGFLGDVFVRAVAGFASAPLPTLAVYYIMSAVPPRFLVNAVALAIGLLQAPAPLARLISPSLLDVDGVHAVFTLELGLALLSLGAVALVRLPPSQKQRVFEALDIITYLLFTAGIALLLAVVGLGQVNWWFDQPWLGYALAAALPLLGAALFIEARRRRPLLDLKWLTARDFIRFIIVALVGRLVLSEQGSVINLLSLLGVNNDELGVFSALMVSATVGGALAAALLLKPSRLGELATLAIGFVAVAALYDARSTHLVRAPQFYATQMAVAFATAMFMGPALLFGVARVLKTGGTQLVSFLVVFVVSQTLGGVGASALLGTYQIIMEKSNSVILAGQLSAFNPMVANRIAVLSKGAGGGSAAALAALHQTTTREANVLAFNSTFQLLAVVAAATTVYLAILLLIHWLSRHARSGRASIDPHGAQAEAAR